MDDETRELLERVLALEEENGKILRGMRRSHRISSIMSFLYWAIIIGTSVGVYYYLEPTLKQLLKQYDQISTSIKKASNVIQQFPSPQ